MTRARLKAGPSHPLDIMITIATVCVGGFFLLVLSSQLPWRRLFGSKQEEKEDSSDVEEEEQEEDGHEKAE